MKIYVVVFSTYDDIDIIAAYKTREEADQEADRCNNADPKFRWYSVIETELK